MKKEANNKKYKAKETDTGLPVDTELEKEVDELKKKMRRELAEAKQKAKKKKGQ